MADKLLLEDGSGGYLLEDESGVLLIDVALAAIVGTLSATEDALTLTGAGNLSRVGTLSATEAALTLSALGKVIAQGGVWGEAQRRPPKPEPRLRWARGLPQRGSLPLPPEPKEPTPPALLVSGKLWALIRPVKLAATGTVTWPMPTAEELIEAEQLVAEDFRLYALLSFLREAA